MCFVGRNALYSIKVIFLEKASLFLACFIFFFFSQTSFSLFLDIQSQSSAQTAMWTLEAIMCQKSKPKRRRHLKLGTQFVLVQGYTLSAITSSIGLWLISMVLNISVLLFSINCRCLVEPGTENEVSKCSFPACMELRRLSVRNKKPFDCKHLVMARDTILGDSLRRYLNILQLWRRTPSL